MCLREFWCCLSTKQHEVGRTDQYEPYEKPMNNNNHLGSSYYGKSSEKPSTPPPSKTGDPPAKFDDNYGKPAVGAKSSPPLANKGDHSPSSDAKPKINVDAGKKEHMKREEKGDTVIGYPAQPGNIMKISESDEEYKDTKKKKAHEYREHAPVKRSLDAPQQLK